MKHNISIGLLLLAFAHSGLVLASDKDPGMDHSAMKGGSAMQAQTHKAEGVVNKIDVQHNIVNLTHGPIKSLGWSGMTMDFQVKDVAILKNVKAGQKVDFEVVNEGPGKYYVTRITPAK